MTTNTSKPVNRVAKHFGKDLGDRVYETADKMASTLLRLLERHQQQRCEALVGELERIKQELTSLFNEEPEAEATPKPSADGSGANRAKPTANAAGDDNPIPVLLIDLLSFDIALGWIV